MASGNSAPSPLSSLLSSLLSTATCHAMTQRYQEVGGSVVRGGVVVCFKPLLIGNTMPSYRYLGGIPPSESSSSSTSSSSKSSFFFLSSQVLGWVLLEHLGKAQSGEKNKVLGLNVVVVMYLLLLLLAIPLPPTS